MTFSLCEVAFRVTDATFLRLRLCTEDSQGDPEKINVAPRFAIDRDGERIIDLRLTGAETTVPVLSSPTAITEIRLIKLSECTQSILGLSAIETDGVLSPLPTSDRRLEFIGDSITCGYGVEAESAAEGFSTATENAEKSYAGLTAKALRAAPMLTAFSGHGIVSGYTGDPAVRNESELVPPYYETFGRQDFILPSGRKLQEIPWDFSRFQPQGIVVNLGTNDLSWCGDDEKRKAMFRKEYAAFLRCVRSHYPDALILCVLGLMGEKLNQTMLSAVEDYRSDTGDHRIRSMTVPEQDMETNGAGADAHPSSTTQRLFAETVTDALRELLHW